MNTINWMGALKNSLYIKPLKIVIILIAILFSFKGIVAEVSANKVNYEPSWESLSQWKVPRWFDKAVLGFYCHWGVCSVPGFRFNEGSERVDSGLWYGWFMYFTFDVMA